MSRRQSTRRSHRRPALRLEALETRSMMTADLAALSDEFEDPASRADWQRIHLVEGWNADQLAGYDVGATHPGRLTMVPHSTGWYEDYRGPLAFKEVSGDFRVTTLVHVTDRDDVGNSDPDNVPNDSTFSLGGVMIRTPRDITSPADWSPGSGVEDGTVNGENYVFLSFGYGQGPAAMSLELKNTRNSHSDVQLLPLAGDPAALELQLTRSGDSVTAAYRQPGSDAWQVAGSFVRPDLPDTLQVGLVAYTDWDKMSGFDPFFHNGHVLSPATIPAALDPNPAVPFDPDIEASFEFIRFEPLPADCDGMRIGMNLEPLGDHSRGMPWRDAFLSARPWSTWVYNTVTGEFGYQALLAPEGPALALDEQGWVASLATFGNAAGEELRQVARSEIFTEPAHNLGGLYTLEWDGTGTIYLFGSPVVPQGMTPDGSHFAEIDVPAASEVVLYIAETDPADPVRNIDFWLPDYNGVSFVGSNGGNFDPTDPAAPPVFHPAYLERLAPFDTLRAIQWQAITTNASVTWDDRRRFDDAMQTNPNDFGQTHTPGVAPEYLIALANELDANLWVHMPHAADDEYVQSFAELVRDHLEPDRTAYVEYSNEIWNYYFAPWPWLVEQSAAAGVEPLVFAAGEMRHDFEIWSDAFSGQEQRLVRVVAGQAGNLPVIQTLAGNADGQFDALSITGYAGLLAETLAAFPAGTTPQQILDEVATVSIPWAVNEMQQVAALAGAYSVSLGRDIQVLAYEGGSHLFSDSPFSDLTQAPAYGAAVEASNSPAMYDLYTTLLTGLQSAGTDLYNEYTFIFNREPVLAGFGAYGVLDSQFGPVTPQYQALVDFAAAPGDCEAATPVVAIGLAVTDADGQVLTDVMAGERFWLDVSVQDLRADGTGVFAAFADVTFSPEGADVAGPLQFGAAYVNAATGDTSADGLIDEVGAIAGLDPLGGGRLRLFRVPVVATQPGELVFAADPADVAVLHDVLVYGQYDPVSPANIDYGRVRVRVHSPLAANDDEFAITNDGTPARLDVLANDTSGLGESLTLVSVSEPSAGGTATIADGRLVYVPAVGFFGDETLTYEVSAGEGATARATVTIHVARGWHHRANPLDVTSDGWISALDALHAINYLNEHGAGLLPTIPTPSQARAGRIDTNGDGYASALDVLLVIDELNRRNTVGSSGPSAEGEPTFAARGDMLLGDMLLDHTVTDLARARRPLANAEAAAGVPRVRPIAATRREPTGAPGGNDSIWIDLDAPITDLEAAIGGAALPCPGYPCLLPAVQKVR